MKREKTGGEFDLKNPTAMSSLIRRGMSSLLRRGMSSLPSYKRDPTGHVETWRTHGNANLSPSPIRQDQIMSGDRRSKVPLKYYPVQQKTILDKYPRASFAVCAATFIGIYAWFKYDSLRRAKEGK